MLTSAFKPTRPLLSKQASTFSDLPSTGICSPGSGHRLKRRFARRQVLCPQPTLEATSGRQESEAERTTLPAEQSHSATLLMVPEQREYCPKGFEERACLLAGRAKWAEDLGDAELIEDDRLRCREALWFAHVCLCLHESSRL
ncbi:hypothetical protein WJX73_007879 [Symbiochloris irregularis]|uniref:Uncharacterized protein n=1 Tax=Symbiochloris irregularis TaxID=706552 RepID=A0AAW1P319_9CHLO